MTNRKSHTEMDALLKGIKTLLVSLPSEEEKRELTQTLNEAQSFLNELSSLVQAIPTMESSRELSDGLSRLDVLVERAPREDGLRKLLGLKGSMPHGPRRPTTPEGVQARASRLQQELAQMETPDVVASLAQSREPLAVLAELANLLGMRTRSKERKPDLAKRIAVQITNQRGYDLLGGKTPAPPANP